MGCFDDGGVVFFRSELFGAARLFVDGLLFRVVVDTAFWLATGEGTGCLTRALTSGWACSSRVNSAFNFFKSFWISASVRI